MDILSVAISDTSKLTVRHPMTGVDTDIVIEVFSRDSVAYKTATSAISKKFRKRKDVTLEERETAAIELLGNVTKGWTNLEEKGKKLSFSIANAIRIYTELPWLRNQIDAFIGDEQNFLDEAKTN